MLNAYTKIWQNPYVRALIGLLAVIALYLLFARTRAAWVPFLLAYTLAYLADPLVTGLQRRRVPRWIGVLAVMTVIFAVLSLTSLVAASLVDQVTVFVTGLPDSDEAEGVIIWLEVLPERIERALPPRVYSWGTSLFENANLEGLNETLAARVEEMSANVFLGVVAVVGGVAQFGAMIVLTIFLLFSFQYAKNSLFGALPQRFQPLLRDLAVKLDLSVGSYIKAQLLIALLVGVLIWLGMLLLGVPLPVAIGVVAAVFNIVPFLGPVIAFIPAALLALSLGWWYVIATLVIFIVVNQLDGNVLSPIIFARTTKLHPLVIMTSLLVGASLLGLIGALIAVPAASFLKLLYEDYYLTSRWYLKS